MFLLSKPAGQKVKIIGRWLNIINIQYFIKRVWVWLIYFIVLTLFQYFCGIKKAS